MLNSPLGLYGFGGELQEPLGGIDPDVLFGYPVLILGGIALVCAVEVMSVPRTVLESRRQVLLMIGQVAGVGISVVAGANVLGSVFLGLFAFGSGPLVALVGGILITRSIKQA